MRTHRRSPRRSRERGLLLGVVLVLLGIVVASGALALWSMRTDTGAAGSDRLSRQLLDCAEQGLTWGKQYMATYMNTGNSVAPYIAANICSSGSSTSTAGPLPCTTSGGPFPATCTGTPPSGYPGSAPFTQQLKMDSRQGNNDFEYTVGFLNDPAATNPCVVGTSQTIIVYSRCTDLSTMQQRAVEAAIKVDPPATKTDYAGQAGRGFRNQGNSNF